MHARRLFITIARAEGVSVLLLFFVAMPLKYGLGYVHATEGPGWIHGMLFMAYLGALAWMHASERWSLAFTFTGVVASFLPFGTFWFETRLPAPPDASP